MPIPPDTDLSDPRTRLDMKLWTAISIGPLTWFSLLLVMYWKSGEKCVALSRAWFVLWLLVAGGLTALGGAYARKQNTDLGSTPAPLQHRVRLMTWSGLMLSAFSLFLLFTLSLPLLAWKPCE